MEIFAGVPLGGILGSRRLERLLRSEQLWVFCKRLSRQMQFRRGNEPSPCFSARASAMNFWRRLPFSLLALWAVLLTLVPQTVWACPMTGRVDVASRVCLGAMPMAGSEMPCARFGGKCCKPLQIPPTQSSDDSHHPPLLAASQTTSFGFAFVAPALDTVAFVVPTVETSLAPAVALYLARHSHSPPSFWTQHRPPTLAGRAPPVL